MQHDTQPQEGMVSVTVPATFEPLVSDYEHTWQNGPAESLPEGQTFERAKFELPNGYVVTVVRTNAGAPSVGYENGLWEAVISRPTNDPLWLMLGLERQPAVELDHLLPDEIDGARLAGNLDSAGVNALIAQVMEQPQAPEATDNVDGFDLLQYLSGGGAK